jgi:transposase
MREHEQREEVDAAIVCGDSSRVIAARFGVSPSAVILSALTTYPEARAVVSGSLLGLEAGG